MNKVSSPCFCTGSCAFAPCQTAAVNVKVSALSQLFTQYLPTTTAVSQATGFFNCVKPLMNQWNDPAKQFLSVSYLLHGNVSSWELKTGANISPSHLTEERWQLHPKAAPISKHNSQVTDGDVPGGRDSSLPAGQCASSTQNIPQADWDLCDFSWMWTSGKETPWKHLTEAFIRSVHQLLYFKTGFFLCTSPGFIRAKLLVHNYWQCSTLLNTSTEVIQNVYASDAGNAVYKLCCHMANT